MLPVKVVCFDLGGVLIEINRTWQDALLASGLEAGIATCSLSSFPQFDDYQNGLLTTEQYIEALSNFLRIGAREALDAHMNILIREYPGVASLVARLDKEGVLCGCLSNTNTAHWATFFEGGQFAFGPSLRVRVGSHIEHLSKPEATIFRIFEQACGFQAADIAYFDDSEANVQAASTLGWQAWLIDPERDTASQMRTHLGLPD